LSVVLPIVEHVIDPRRLPERAGVSVAEASLGRLLGEGRAPRRFLLAEGFRFHGGNTLLAEERLAGDTAASAGLDPDLAPPLASFAGLLERGADRLAAARAAYRESCRLAAVQARELAAFAALRPASALDRPDEEVGAAAAASRAARPAALTEVSEWAVDEVMVAVGMSSQAASRLLEESVILVERLPGTLTALENAVIGPLHARMLVEVLGPVRDEVRGRLEDELLAKAAGKTVPQLRAAAQRAVLRADAASAAWRAAKAIRDRGVRACPGTDGMGSLTGTMPVPVLMACRDALRRYAEACAVPGDQRTLDQRTLDCLVDLILRPGETGLPPVQAQLTVVVSVNSLTGGDEPGEINGQPVPAAMLRELAYVLGLLPRPASGPAEQTQAGDATGAETTGPETDADGNGTGTEAEVGAETDADAEVEAVAEMEADDEAETDREADDEVAEVEAEDEEEEEDEDEDDEPAAAGGAGPDPGETTAMHLAGLLGLRSIAGTALARLPQIAVVEEFSGQLLALTTAAGIRHAATCGHRACRTGRRPCAHSPSGPGLGPPPDTPGYRPSVPLDTFVRARDRRCRFPGCRAAAIRCDLDHAMHWPAGPTSADNLCCLCRHHHRLSHQAPGWRMRLLPDGGLEWTTPGGERITTHPPAYGIDDPPPTPTPPEPEPPPLTLRELVLGRPPQPGDEPAPF
jgi:hypothetical protein